MYYLSTRNRLLAFLLCIGALFLTSTCDSRQAQSPLLRDPPADTTAARPPATASASADGLTAASTAASAPEPTPESAPVNLVANGDFETGDLTGWTVDGDAVVSDAEHHAGDRSARITSNGEATYIESTIPTEVGKIYKLTGWVEIVNDSGDDWGGFRLSFASSDWEHGAETESLLAKSRGHSWFKVALTYAATTPETRVRAEYFGGPDRSMVVNVDDLAIFERRANHPPEINVSLDPLEVPGLPRTQRYSVTGDDPDGAIVRVMWDFGDGTRALSPSGERRAALPGNYVATVRVADDDGAITTRTVAWSATGAGFPALSIAAPAAAETTVSDPSLAVSGSADGSARVLVSSDRGFAGAATGTAQWSAHVALQPGLNHVLVQANGADGHISTAERLVRYVPAAPLRIAGLAARAPSVQRWDIQEITFALENSAATDPQFPYDPAPPPGLEWVDGVSVDGLFSPDDWQTVYRRPAFLNQRYERALKDGQEWLYPADEPVWTVRFAPPHEGTWKYRIEVYEARGTAQSEEQSFTVVAPTEPRNHGPVQVAPHDTRYFEFADGTPFLGAGHGVGIGPERFSYEMIDTFDQIGADNQDFFRWWLGGDIWGSAWQAWRSRTLDYDGYVPATGLSVERAYGQGLAALKLDADNPIMFQGHETGHAGLIPGHTYRLRVRWRTEGVTGPAAPGKPYGVTVKFVDDWPDVGQTGDTPALIAHVNGDTPWHVAEADFVAQGDFMPNVGLILENSTAGAAYVDEVDLYEVLAGQALGPQLLLGSRFNSQLTFDLRHGAGVDAILAEAAARGMSFKLVISEKSEYLLNHLAPDGLPDAHGHHFDAGAGTPNRRLHEYYWRHLFARFGAFRSVHSWELLNEGAPEPGGQFDLAAALAAEAAKDGDPHMTTTSTWGTLAKDIWKAPENAALTYVDFHAYIRSTGWIEPQDELAEDSARLFAEYDQAVSAAGFGKPVVFGELGIEAGGDVDGQDPLLAHDQQGVWLHKLTWARCGPGGLYPLYWYTDNIFSKSLHPIFGAWKRFMDGIPLTNGRYRDVAAIASDANLRVLGQKDLQDGRAYLWIDNRRDTWKAVVDGKTISAISGTVRVGMGQPGATYKVTWYDTATGQPTTTEMLTATAEGDLVLPIANLKSDTAVKIAR